MALALVLLLALGACADRENGADHDGSEAGNAEKAAAEPVGVAPVKGAKAVGEAADPRGGTADGAYRNEYFGLSFAPGEDWRFFSDEEKAALGSDGGAFYDLCAVGDEGLYTVNVVIEDIGEREAIFYDEEGYVDASLEALGDGAAEKVRVTFAGEERFAVKTSGEYTLDEWKSAAYYQLAVCMKEDRYIGIVTFTSFFEDKTADLAAMWRKI